MQYKPIERMLNQKIGCPLVLFRRAREEGLFDCDI